MYAKFELCISSDYEGNVIDILDQKDRVLAGDCCGGVSFSEEIVDVVAGARDHAGGRRRSGFEELICKMIWQVAFRERKEKRGGSKSGLWQWGLDCIGVLGGCMMK